MRKLKQASYAGPKGPVVLTIMDGIGIGKDIEGDAVRSAHTPHLDWLKKHVLSSHLKAHGTAVGLPSDSDMGNSEVGHNAMGCGRVCDQGAKLVTLAIESGLMFKAKAWNELIQNCQNYNSALHFIGLLSDGNVHSHIKHLKSMLIQAKKQKIKKARIHILLDGRDVPETSALSYVDDFEDFLKELNADNKTDFCIASGGGRMQITMDRYEANWSIVQRGWDTHVRGAGKQFPSARIAIDALRKANPGVIDQDLPPFVIAAGGKPVGAITDRDSVIFFNFRGDRAIEISRAFEEETFTAFDRVRHPAVSYAGMMQYDGDLKIPKRYLVEPPLIEKTLAEYLCKAGMRQMAISETQKFGHVTYFFDGNRSGKFNAELEEYIEVPSDIVPFEQRPWMKAAEITDKVTGAIYENRFPFIRLNYPNGDMVGHTGIYQATEIGVEAVDLCIGRLIQAVKAVAGIMIVTADHGNADDMFERDKETAQIQISSKTGKPCQKTSHSLNPVPFFVYAPSQAAKLSLTEHKNLGIASIAATCLTLLGFVPPDDYEPSIVKIVRK